jgi:UDP-N-acetylglucosamine 2-epimerase (non-hydrolysing)
MRILSVVGARPNFVKIAPLLAEMGRRSGVDALLVHTGQHYDGPMSEQFFRDLGIRRPDFSLDVGSGSHAVQTAEVMKRIEPVLVAQRPDAVLVVGDVNSTLAAALTAAKLGIRVAHVEAGLRSFDRTMPEEINRLLTDAISDVLFVTEESGRDHLLREGVDASKIHFVGNVMIDALLSRRAAWEQSGVFSRLPLEPESPYAVLTLHRPSNVDNASTLTALMEALQELGRYLPVVFPVHPRVQPSLTALEFLTKPPESPFRKGIVCTAALGYLEFIHLMSRARLVLTDSGGIQEETTVLGVPCLTLRDNTERPVTVTHGTNRVIGTDPRRIVREALGTLEAPPRPGAPPPRWDGQAARRIMDILLSPAR